MKLTQTLSAIMCSIILISGVSCSKINDFEKQLDELDSRVTAMESQIKDLRCRSELRLLPRAVF